MKKACFLAKIPKVQTKAFAPEFAPRNAKNMQNRKNPFQDKKMDENVKKLAKPPFARLYQKRKDRKKYDKNTICLPRQYTDTALAKPMKCLILLGFSRVRERVVVGFRPHLDHLKLKKW